MLANHNARQVFLRTVLAATAGIGNALPIPPPGTNMNTLLVLAWDKVHAGRSWYLVCTAFFAQHVYSVRPAVSAQRTVRWCGLVGFIQHDRHSRHETGSMRYGLHGRGR